ncbi:complement factor H-related protein 4-like isoform X2 [Myotis lucifugus]|uniref:complement factor H-related protein 4-like isoform X2 n=1 Tax=Myotis lucifugus TaxID=59463 RepID=UPI000CCC1829|nr:complement factor H-related protein 4-like isoform X2 [Myotis lucifugus]
MDGPRKCPASGQSIKIDCDPGYSLSDPQSTVTCTEHGWSSPPSCIKHCDMPIFGNATAIITGKPFRPNDMLDYQCLDGYENRDGSKKGSMVCESSDKCGPPPGISNGDITSITLKMYHPWSTVR